MRGGRNAARLEAPGRPALDLATARDDEVLAWFLQQQQYD
jgi:hypothetical protein